jgi:hypothetical protein
MAEPSADPSHAQLLDAVRAQVTRVDGVTIDNDASRSLRVKPLGITDAQVAVANKDGAAGTASMRTLGDGALQAAPGQHGKSLHASGADPLLEAPSDPGDTKDLVVTNSAFHELTCGGVDETRGLPDPTFVGQRALVFLRSTAGGEITLTAATAVTDSGITTCTFGTAGQTIEFVATNIGGSSVWRVTGPTDVLLVDDGHVWIPAADFEAVIGTWTVKKDGIGDNVITKRKTAAAADGIITASVKLPFRGATGKGRKLTSYDVVYKVSTALCTDFLAFLRLGTIPANGVAMTYTDHAGAVDGDYTAPHDSAAGRGAVGNHTARVTVASPVYLSSSQALIFDPRVYSVATPTSVFDFVGIRLNFDENPSP